jgi:hypothetical protein
MEPRYVVLKLKDMEAANLTQEEKAAFVKVCQKVDRVRAEQDRGMLICAVIESDWPEFGPVCDAVMRRANGETIALGMDTATVAIEKLQPKDGDVLVVNLPPGLSLDQMDSVSLSVQEATKGMGIPVVATSDKIGIQVVRREVAEAAVDFLNAKGAPEALH